jgi:hypothetical protein
MNLLLRALCLLVYLMALGRLSGLLVSDVFSRSPTVAGVLLLLHVLELIFLFKHVRLYKGSLAVSVLLTLLFGLLHWKPLADEQKRLAGRA